MRFEAVEVAIEAVAALREPVEKLARRDADLARQIRRAASGIVLQTSEGGRRMGKDRDQMFRTAAGSCSETLDALRVAEAWGHVKAAETARARALLDRVNAILVPARSSPPVTRRTGRDDRSPTSRSGRQSSR